VAQLRQRFTRLVLSIPELLVGLSPQMLAGVVPCVELGRDKLAEGQVRA
jgi:hypothetical protein